ncbi:unnamed protein product [Symbiodinium sp. CCMP2592]|nr:unnamed protein product [Symbiodinium sp. CCMP2592]
MSFQQKQQVRTDLLQHPGQLEQMNWDTDGSILKSVAEHLREKRVENRRLKAKNKKAKAKNDGEDVDVPETANTLKQLKSETGEALWDFEAADEFSDDQEEDTEEKHRELVVPDGNQVLAPEEGAETDSDDDAHMLSKHGHDLQVLLDRQKDPEDQDEDSQDDPSASAALRQKSQLHTKASSAKAKPKTKRKA